MALPLGLAIDRVEAVNRIAGQYDGLGGDQQFRIYVTLKPGTRELLEKSREFFVDHENTVYHVGFPHSYRQAGKEPNMQMSMSEDGLRADIDVDYRSSRSPQSLFNGHLTASNSDVRAGDNPKLHNARWSGLIMWWQDTFGKLQVVLPKPVDLANTDRAMGPPTPLPPDRPSGAAPEQDRGRRAGVPHRLAGPAPVQSGARVPLAAGLCLPEPERRCEEPGA